MRILVTSGQLLWKGLSIPETSEIFGETKKLENPKSWAREKNKENQDRVKQQSVATECDVWQEQWKWDFYGCQRDTGEVVALTDGRGIPCVLFTFTHLCFTPPLHVLLRNLFRSHLQEDLGFRELRKAFPRSSVATVLFCAMTCIMRKDWRMFQGSVQKIGYAKDLQT